MSRIFVTTKKLLKESESDSSNAYKNFISDSNSDCWFELSDYLESSLRDKLLEKFELESISELIILEYEDIPKFFHSESYNAELLAFLIEYFDNYSEYDLDLIQLYFESEHTEISDYLDDIERFKDDYIGEFSSISDFGKHIYNEEHKDFEQKLSDLDLDTQDIDWENTSLVKDKHCTLGENDTYYFRSYN